MTELQAGAHIFISFIPQGWLARVAASHEHPSCSCWTHSWTVVELFRIPLFLALPGRTWTRLACPRHINVHLRHWCYAAPWALL